MLLVLAEIVHIRRKENVTADALSRTTYGYRLIKYCELCVCLYNGIGSLTFDTKETKMETHASPIAQACENVL